MDLKNKRVLVTGASSGIGAAIAVSFAQKGAVVFINYRGNEKGAQATLAEVEKYSSGRVYQADLTQRDKIKEMFSEIRSAYGDIDILVNNAGDARSGQMFDAELWDYEYNSIFLSTLHAIEDFLASDTEAQRKIINISSIYGALHTGNPSHYQYSAAKAAVSSLTCNLAKSFGNKVLVNAVSPGYTWTPVWEKATEERRRKVVGTTKIGRWIEPREIAHAVVFLAENDAMTGQIITVDGGTSIMQMS